MSDLFRALTGFDLAAPWLLALALLVPLAIWLGIRGGRPAARFSAGGFLRRRGLPSTWRARLRFLPAALAVLGLLLAIVALARPVERVAVPVTNEGIDILLLIDTSSSMAANDLDPERTRLDLAKRAAALFVAGRPDDRIGLVTFARFPDLRCPPTRDHDALAAIIDEVALVENEGPEDATGIGTAVARAAQVLAGAGTKARVAILLTDGEENVATAGSEGEIAPVHAGQLCRELGVRAYTIAAGLGRRDRSGRFVPADTRAVRALATGTGGRFFAARDAGAVSTVYEEIDKLEKGRFAEPRIEVVERFLPFLLAAVALLLFGRLLGGSVLAVLP